MNRTPKRLLRILLAGSALAAGFLAVDLLSSHDSAAAADLVPDTISSITTPVAPIVTPLAAPVVEAVAQTSAPVVAPAASTLAPVLAPVATPVITSVIVPLEPAVTALTEPLAPVAHAAIDPFVPAIGPLLPVVADALTVLPALPLASVTPDATLLSGGLVLLGVAAAASVIQLLPLPGNSPSPRKAPEAPTGAFSPLFAADLAYGLAADSRSALSARATTEQIPSSPTFVSDTTPD